MEKCPLVKPEKIFEHNNPMGGMKEGKKTNTYIM